MIALDEDALICDLAETYGIYHYRALPILTIATLAAGLRPNSRIHARMAGISVPFDTMILAQGVDLLSSIRWMLSEDGQKGRNMPKWIAPKLIDWSAEPDTGRFSGADEFEAARAVFFEEEGD